MKCSMREFSAVAMPRNPESAVMTTALSLALGESHMVYLSPSSPSSPDASTATVISHRLHLLNAPLHVTLFIV